MSGWPSLPSPGASPVAAPVVIKISPMAHLAVGFFTLGLLVPVLTWHWLAPLLVIPILLSALIARLRTVADQDTVTARTLLGSTTVAVDRRRRTAVRSRAPGPGAPAQGRLVRYGCPAVTFATLPLLTEASGGRVPNPYELGSSSGSAERIAAVEQHPHRDATADAEQQCDERPDERTSSPAAAGVEPVAARTDQDDRGRHHDQRELVLVPVGQEEREVAAGRPGSR